jgi:hypothetical protein
MSHNLHRLSRFEWHMALGGDPDLDDILAIDFDEFIGPATPQPSNAPEPANAETQGAVVQVRCLTKKKIANKRPIRAARKTSGRRATLKSAPRNHSREIRKRTYLAFSTQCSPLYILWWLI